MVNSLSNLASKFQLSKEPNHEDYERWYDYDDAMNDFYPDLTAESDDYSSDIEGKIQNYCSFVLNILFRIVQQSRS